MYEVIVEQTANVVTAGMKTYFFSASVFRGNLGDRWAPSMLEPLVRNLVNEKRTGG